MNQVTRQELETAQEKAREARETIRETNRSALRSYLRAAFTFQRAGLDALDALQRGTEELTFTMLDRAEEAQERYVDEAQHRLRESTERLQEARERIQARVLEEQGDAEEVGDRAGNHVREGANIGVKVLKVMETRVETMLAELLDMGRRELNEIEERVDALVERLDRELEDELHPIVNYDEKNVEEIREELEQLDEMQLRTIRAYEVSHKNRVTVLRAIDEKLAARDELNGFNRDETIIETVEEEFNDLLTPIADYDDKNVEEVEAALADLDAAELGTVRAYEIAHKDRVTVLRAIDERLAVIGREEMPA